jgi:hypothetical protein
MSNQNVFRGNDAALVMAVDDTESVEGKTAQGIIEQYELSNIVGRLKNVTLRAVTELTPYHEIGKRYASELRPGNIDIFGSADRAHINGALIRLLLGDGANSPAPQTTIAQPTFNLVLTLTDPRNTENVTTMTAFGVKFSTWNYTAAQDDFVMEAVEFRALRLANVDEAAA